MPEVSGLTVFLRHQTVAPPLTDFIQIHSFSMKTYVNVPAQRRTRTVFTSNIFRGSSSFLEFSFFSAGHYYSYS